MSTVAVPATLKDAIRFFFADLDRCTEILAASRWPDGVKCPTCGNARVTYIKARRIWQCNAGHRDKKQFSVKVGTIFEDSPLGLDKWFTAAWMVADCKNGVSSYEIHRAIGVTQKTAWFMDHRIRLAMQSGTFEKVAGKFEADESSIGGLARNRHKDKKAKITGTGGAGIAVVMGILDRERGKVRVKPVENVQRETLQAEIYKHVEEGSEVFTDAWIAYNGLDRGYVHGVIDHAEGYVNGQIHTNGIENFWSLLKRA